MSDRELLEKAAKAAGVVGEYVERKRVVTDIGVEHFTGIMIGSERCWNPLTDDGDALRLAVKLDLSIELEPQCADVAGWCTVYYCDHAGDKCAATRRAIVRAAAALEDR